MTNLPAGAKMTIRYEKCQKSTAVSRSFVVLVVSLLPLISTISLVDGRIVRDLCIDSNSSTGYDDDICLTPGCIHSASAILKNMDFSVDPCEDFYRYACGGFINETILPNSESSEGSFSIEYKNVLEQIKLRLGDETEPNEPKHSKLAKTLYKLCINKTAIDAVGFDFLRGQLDQMGGWPVLLGDAWDQNEFVWTEMIYKFREAGYGFDSIIDFSITPDVKNSTKRVIYIDQASLVLDRPVFMEGFNNSIIDAYYSYMVDIAEMFGANRFRALTELKESLAFEMNLAKISVPDEERRNVTKLYNPMTVSELTNKYPTIPWREYLSKMLPSSITVEDDEVVIVMAPSYFDNLEKLLDAIPKRVQANYLMWRAIAENLRFLHNDVLNRRQQFFTVLYGNTERQARTDECTSTVAERLSISVAAMYVKQYFKEDAKKNAVAMVADIRRQFYHILGRIDWMDEKTRVKALHKASAMVAHIGYPDELLDDRKVNEFYRNFDISGDNYLENILNHNKLEADRTFGTLREPVNKTEWINHARSAVINAYNYPQLNSIEFTAAILRGAFFDNDRPNYMNYGGIGFIIGHEITHGFDDVGKGFDADGELDNWWDATTDDNFHQRAQCIIEQYSNYTVPEIGMNLNGIKTQGENIADNGGIKIAYLAYKSWVERNKPEKRLPGIDRTPEQMFWLSAANAWCAKVKREALAMDVVSEMHSPDEFRVFGPFSNMPEFANDYKCPKGSRMNPEKKCSLW